MINGQAKKRFLTPLISVGFTRKKMAYCGRAENRFRRKIMPPIRPHLGFGADYTDLASIAQFEMSRQENPGYVVFAALCEVGGNSLTFGGIRLLLL
jgi:hypothetical protein